VFGRDGGLTKVDLLARRIDKRIIQAGNSIGGSISQDGRLIVAQNYEPGGIKAFDADTLELLAEVPAEYAPGKFSKVVGLADVSGQRFVYALFEAGEIWVTDFTDPRRPSPPATRPASSPTTASSPPTGATSWPACSARTASRCSTCGSPSAAPQDPRRLRPRREKLPVFKMPHLRGWSLAGGQAWLPAIGRHEVLVADARSWQETARVPVKGQPVFVMARPDGRQVWVNFAFPDNEWVQVIDTVEKRVVHTFSPGKAVLHMEFSPAAKRSGCRPATATGSAWWTPPPSPSAASSPPTPPRASSSRPRAAHRVLR
jgi:protein NirF